jgi:hypothetical protein
MSYLRSLEPNAGLLQIFQAFPEVARRFAVQRSRTRTDRRIRFGAEQLQLLPRRSLANRPRARNRRRNAMASGKEIAKPAEYGSDVNTRTLNMKRLTTILAVVALAGVGSAIAQENEKSGGQEVSVTGEVIDMSCYVDHGATGEKHAGCAKKCIESGLPVGIKANDGKTYVVIGDHKPLNSELANDAAKTVTVKGKLVSRDGINMVENAMVQK